MSRNGNSSGTQSTQYVKRNTTDQRKRPNVAASARNTAKWPSSTLFLSAGLNHRCCSKLRPLQMCRRTFEPRQNSDGSHCCQLRTKKPLPEAEVLMEKNEPDFCQPNSGRRRSSCSFRRATMLECIWLTRDSDKPSVLPISFIVNSS